MHKEAGRPWPVICPEDDVIDYMILEAVAIKVRREDQEAAKAAEVKNWKKEKQAELRQFT